MDRQWTDADGAMWHTCQIVADIEARRVPEARVSTYFALKPGEVALVSGPYSLHELRADGDGSYGTSSLVLATSPAMAVGSMIGTIWGNSIARSRAEAAAQVMWRENLPGELIVTNLGFYLNEGGHLYWWNWDGIDALSMIGFNVVEMSGQGVERPVLWRISSYWAELVFVLWAMARHPQHPQLPGRQWVPPGWAQWAAWKGYPCPMSGPWSPVSTEAAIEASSCVDSD